MEKRLYRNEHDKVLAGVSSGLADYLKIDVMVVRLLFILSAIFIPGSGILAYIILWIVVPVNNDPSSRFSRFNEFYQNTGASDPMFNSPNAFINPSNSGEPNKWNTPNAGQGFGMPNQPPFTPVPKSNDTGRTIAGLILLVLGVFFLLREFVIIPAWFSIFKLWPLAIVAIGISLIFKNQRKNEWEQFKKHTEDTQKSTVTPPPVSPETDDETTTKV